MLRAIIPANETDRLAELSALRILDTPQEERFDRIVRLVADVFDVPIAYIALVDSERQWFKAKCGLTTDETGRDISFCGHTIAQDEPLIIADASQDDRFSDNPLVVGEPFVRFYAGFPLHGAKGFAVGTLCIASPEPRHLTSQEFARLRQFAQLAEHELNMVDLIETQRELLQTKRALIDSQTHLTHELAEAAQYVRSLLPNRLDGAIATDWAYVSSSQLGGDLFGYHWLDEGTLAIYLLDVMGHGIGASLLSVSIFNALRSESLGSTDPRHPAEMLRMLNRAFPMEQHGDRFFTIWYGVLETNSRRLCYASGGHHPALLFADHDAPAPLGNNNPALGVIDDLDFEQHEVTIPAQSRLYLFSDGTFEIERPDRSWLGLQEFGDLLARVQPTQHRVAEVLSELRQQQATDEFRDDVSLLELQFDS